MNKGEKFEYLRSYKYADIVSLSFADMSKFDDNEDYDGTPDMILMF